MKKIVGLFLSVISAACFMPSVGIAQHSIAATTTTAVTAATTIPKLVNYSGVVNDLSGKPLISTSGVTFLLYKDSQGGAPLWMETQSVHPDKTGHYAVVLGSTTSQGLPSDVFVSGEARWLAVQIDGQPEQPRVLLVAVPYAMKAGDAETIGGLPPSAFMLAPPVTTTGLNAAGVVSPTTATATGLQPALTGTGTTNFIPRWTSTTALGNSAIFQTGTGTSSKVGINTTTPVSPLDINGGTTFRGPLNLLPMGTATGGSGKTSQFQGFQASSFNNSTSKAITQTFRLQAEPSGNNSANPSGTLNLLFGSGSTTPTETGLKIASNGIITFASGQTFGGGGGGTITGVLAGTDLKGGGTSGTVTLNLDTTKVPQLASNNSFTGTQTVVNNNANGAIQVTDSAGVAIAGTTTANNFFVPAVSGTATAVGAGLTIGVAGTTNTDSGYGVYGVANTSGIGVYGISTNGIGVIGIGASSQPGVKDIGVLAAANGSVGTGLHGYGWSTSALGSTLNNFGTSVGVWADTSGQTITPNAGVALLATADNAWGVFANNNSTTYPTMVVKNYETSTSAATIFLTFNDTFGGLCSINAHGDLACTGSKSAVVPVASDDAKEGTKKVALYAVEAPENWFEDASSGELSGGAVVVKLENVFGQTVNTDMEYHVFLTPNGDCKGLYVTRKTATSFEVHELGGGKSNIAFDYRIMARRKGYENIRLADRTKDFVPPTNHTKVAGTTTSASNQ